MKKVLIIGSKYSGTKNDPNKIFDSMLSDGIEPELILWEDIVFDIQTNRVRLLINGRDIASEKFDLLIAIGWYKNGEKSIYRDVAYSVGLIMSRNCAKIWNSEIIHQRSTSKLSCMVQLALEGIPVPSTMFSLGALNDGELPAMPFVAKAASASRGDLNFLIKCHDDMSQVHESEAHFIFQPFLVNDHDLRVICFSGNPKLIMRRSRAVDANTHLNNTSQGGNAQWQELSSVPLMLLTKCQEICTIMNREMAGIDLIPDKSSDFGYSCLEVNAIPQLTSGVDSQIKLKAFSDAINEL